jgi:hypothetical protein
MKFKLLAVMLAALITSCKDNKPAEGTYGTAFDAKNASTLADALNSYNNGKDTIYSISGTIENICKHKGCWLSFKDPKGEEFYINNDETFVLPANGKGHKAIAHGKFVKDDKGEVSFETTGVIVE